MQYSYILLYYYCCCYHLLLICLFFLIQFLRDVRRCCKMPR